MRFQIDVAFSSAPQMGKDSSFSPVYADKLDIQQLHLLDTKWNGYKEVKISNVFEFNPQTNHV